MLEQVHYESPADSSKDRVSVFGCVNDLSLDRDFDKSQNDTGKDIQYNLYRINSTSRHISSQLSYLLVDAIIFTKDEVTTDQSSNEWMNVGFFITVQPFLYEHQRLVYRSKSTQVSCMLLCCLEYIPELVHHT